MSIDLKTTSLPEAVYGALRESILSSADAPGAVLTEATVSTRYGVARPTAKAAIERLVSEGLLRRSVHKTAQVPLLSTEDILDLYASRVVIEEAVLRKLAETSTIPPEAAAAHRELTEAARRGDDSPYARPDITFHRALVVGHGSPRLTRMHELIMGEIELCIGQVESQHLLTAPDVATQHQGILDAVAAGDADLAGQRIRDHIHTARDRLLGHANQ